MYPRLPTHTMETLELDLHETRAAGFHRPRIGPIPRRSRMTCRFTPYYEYERLPRALRSTISTDDFTQVQNSTFKTKIEILLSITCQTACRLHGRNINQAAQDNARQTSGQFGVARQRPNPTKSKKSTHPPHRVSNVKARNQKTAEWYQSSRAAHRLTHGRIAIIHSETGERK